ncbi:hypothetical protein [Sphingomonas jaspsi]|uniref:hypothetical protein n=1 Tax=Sphingomonas jaspsi TaxID=392409 RepID=UPI000686ECBF|nr:hypothetical protein [Sphingomonas jaspsi]
MATNDFSQTQLREQQQNAANFKCRLIAESGGMMNADEIRVILDLSTVEEVRNCVAAREVLAVDDNGELRFPVLQFDGRRVRPGLIAILKAAPDTSGWRLLQYLLRSEDGLAGDKPIDLIQGSGKDIERAVRFAKRLED